MTSELSVSSMSTWKMTVGGGPLDCFREIKIPFES